MGYIIGSKKGQEIAESMKAEESWICTDGSTWTKNKDGSVSVMTADGQHFDNAYTPPKSNTYSGGQNYNSGNSQYSGYTIGSDYGKKIANDMAIGSTYTASDGAVWTKNDDGTVSVDYDGKKYSNAYKMDDKGLLAMQQITAGLPYQVIEDTLHSRVNKALTTEGLRDYAFDDTYDYIRQYINDAKAEEMRQNLQKGQYNYQTDSQNWLAAFLANNQPPSYQGKYDAQIDALLNQVLNRENFSYNVQNDPLYQQYADMYRREGDRAMKETMAEAAAGAGGMNTYAVTAAQQAANQYASQLNDRIPELYQLAYQMYLSDLDTKVQSLGILQNADAAQYNRYQDTLNKWQNDRLFAYNMYQDAITQGNLQNQFNYNMYRDAITQGNWQNQFDYNRYQDAINQGNWQSQFDYNAAIDDRTFNYKEQETAQAEILQLIEEGIPVPDYLIERSGWTKEYVDARYNKKNPAPATPTYTYDESYGAGITGTKYPTVKATYKDGKMVLTTDYTDYFDPLEAPETGTNQAPGTSASSAATTGGSDKDKSSDSTDGSVPDALRKAADDLGLGLAYSPLLISNLDAAGGIYEENGQVKWSDGWNATNYRDKLNNYFELHY